jgi:hypothetical protein
LPGQASSSIKPDQAESSQIKQFSEKKGLFYFLPRRSLGEGRWSAVSAVGISASLRLCAINYPKSTPAAKLTPLQTLPGQKAGRFKPMQGKK